MRTFLIGALVFTLALTASAGAASKYLITSTKQIKPSVRHALTGERGAAGPVGPAGIPQISTYESPYVSIPPGGYSTPTVACPAGTRVVGTGFFNSVTDVVFVTSYGSYVGGMFYNGTDLTIDNIHVQAICASGAVVAVAGAVLRSAPKATFAQDVSDALAARQRMT